MPRPAHDRWYKTGKWRRLRARKLKHDPYCQCPHHRGQRVPADTVDHITPHRGNARLFWKWKNLQSLTRDCHNRFKQSEESGGVGFDGACDASGMPLNPDHPWYDTARQA